MLLHSGLLMNNRCPDILDMTVESLGTLLTEKGKEVLGAILTSFEGCEEWSIHDLEARVRDFCEAKGYKAGEVFHPLRVALSGKTTGPGLFEMIEHLGRDKTLERLKKWSA